MLLPRYLMVACLGPEGKAASFNLNLDQKVFLLKTIQNVLPLAQIHHYENQCRTEQEGKKKGEDVP